MDLAKKRKLDDNGIVQSDFELSVADARKIIESFTQDQLLEIVQNAAVRHFDVLDAVRSIADKDPAQRKLFIRGLGWDTTNDKLGSVFSAYGELEEAVVILDKATGKSKGFGFVTFKHVDGAIRALKEPSKKIDGRMTVTNLASAGPTSGGPIPHAVDVSNRKVYVGNVPYDMPGERLLAHFLSYGEIEEGPLGFDKATGKSKGFALFVYKNEDAARASLVDPIKNIDGHQLNCKLAIDGKRGKQPGNVGVSAESQGNGVGLQQTGAVPGSVGTGQYGGTGGVGGITGYGGGYQGGLQGPSPQSQNPLSSSYTSPGVGGPVLSSLAGQVPSSMGVSGGYGSGIGGPYSGSHYGGPGSTGYGGFIGAGGGMGGAIGGLGGSGAGSGAGLGGAGASSGAGLVGTAARLGAGLGGAASGLGGAGAGLGGPGRMSSMYGPQPNAAGMGSGGYSESAHYSLSGGSGFQSQHHQTAGTSSAPRVPHSGMYAPHY